MKRTSIGFLFLLLWLILASVAGCSVLSAQTDNAQDEEPTPTFIPLPTQLAVQTRVDAQSCLILETAAIQTDEMQGDLMAWSPVANELAIVQPVNQYYGWYIGNVLVFDAETAQEVGTSTTSSVFGDLTWSPDGSGLAFVALDQQEGIYTIKIWDIATRIEQDLFGDIENARTNDYASSKGIREWASLSNLAVVSSCGVDCVRIYEYNPVSASLLMQGEVRQNEDTSLVLENQLTSPDGNWMVYADDDDDLWLTSIRDNRVSLLLVRTEVVEIKWSEDSKYLALRTADQVEVYELGCVPE